MTPPASPCPARGVERGLCWERSGGNAIGQEAARRRISHASAEVVTVTSGMVVEGRPLTQRRVNVNALSDGVKPTVCIRAICTFDVGLKSV